MSSHQAAESLVSAIDKSRAWLLELDDATIRHKPSADRWSIAEVVGHMVDSACNNHQRFIRAQEEDEFSFPKYDQNSWTAKSDHHNSNWSDLVQLWSLYNLHLAKIMRAIPPQQLGKSCVIGDSEPCTLAFLLTDYVDHLNHHVAKIRERVGESEQ